MVLKLYEVFKTSLGSLQLCLERLNNNKKKKVGNEDAHQEYTKTCTKKTMTCQEDIVVFIKLKACGSKW